ncbi:hypothetical protein HHK36_002688 [Tetracentron sinense]|uniref:RNase H type-1 domain-containing protein n=1 Tax=Tetracentron sinense TaxID=13715 RepID=A0A834ZW36_TETSI|nr:hypothetical protein HHK36_002688 [Tetracentron sinense]
MLCFLTNASKGREQISSTAQQLVSVPSWRPSPNYFLNINVDGAWDPISNKSRADVIIRDHIGLTIYGHSFPIDATSARVGESKAMFIGLSITSSQGWRSFILEGDVSQIVDVVNTSLKVLDVIKFTEEHPGGDEVLIESAEGRNKGLRSYWHATEWQPKACCLNIRWEFSMASRSKRAILSTFLTRNPRAKR